MAGKLSPKQAVQEKGWQQVLQEAKCRKGEKETGQLQRGSATSYCSWPMSCPVVTLYVVILAK